MEGNRFLKLLIVFGDFNEVHEISEKSTSSHCQNSVFNTFIWDGDLFDLPMRLKWFIWANKHGSKMSKLYRFMVSRDFDEY